MYHRRTSRNYYGDKQGNKSVKFHSGGSHVSANGHVPHAKQLSGSSKSSPCVLSCLPFLPCALPVLSLLPVFGGAIFVRAIFLIYVCICIYIYIYTYTYIQCHPLNWPHFVLENFGKFWPIIRFGLISNSYKLHSTMLISHTCNIIIRYRSRRNKLQ